MTSKVEAALGAIKRRFIGGFGTRDAAYYGARSKYMPRQGTQEIARRLRQAAALAGKKRLPVAPVGRFGWPSPEHSRAVDALNTMYPHSVKVLTESVPCVSFAKTDKPVAIGGVQDSGNHVGRRVAWTSNGVEKVGEITHVVPAGMLPADVGAKVKDVGSTPRDEDSFVVCATTVGKGVPAKVGTYWPRVGVLKFV